VGIGIKNTKHHASLGLATHALSSMTSHRSWPNVVFGIDERILCAMHHIRLINSQITVFRRLILSYGFTIAPLSLLVKSELYLILPKFQLFCPIFENGGMPKDLALLHKQYALQEAA
jgi:hypothetical protein